MIAEDFGPVYTLHARGHRSGAFTTATWCAAGAIVAAILFPLMDSAQGALLVMVPMVFISAAPWGLAVSPCSNSHRMSCAAKFPHRYTCFL